MLLNVYICVLRKNSVPLLPEGTIKFTHPATQQIHRGCQLEFCKQKRGYCQSKNFSGTSDTIKHLKTFREIF